MIIRTNFVPHGFDALTLWPFILVRPQQAENFPLIAHEMVHYREQAWITPFWIARYLLSKKFRFDAEVRAYRIQISLGGITVMQAAELLTRYQTGCEFSEALSAVQA